VSAGLEALDHTLQITHVWINDLEERLGWENKPRAYRLLKAVLHALRDWLQINESAHFAAQLPELLRGVYYEQWRPALAPVKKRSKADFLARVEDSFKADPIDNPGQAVLAVFQLLKKSREARLRSCAMRCPRNCGTCGPSTTSRRELSADRCRRSLANTGIELTAWHFSNLGAVNGHLYDRV